MPAALAQARLVLTAASLGEAAVSQAVRHVAGRPLPVRLALAVHRGRGVPHVTLATPRAVVGTHVQPGGEERRDSDRGGDTGNTDVCCFPPGWGCSSPAKGSIGTSSSAGRDVKRADSELHTTNTKVWWPRDAVIRPSLCSTPWQRHQRGCEKTRQKSTVSSADSRCSSEADF